MKAELTNKIVSMRTNNTDVIWRVPWSTKQMSDINRFRAEQNSQPQPEISQLALVSLNQSILLNCLSPNSTTSILTVQRIVDLLYGLLYSLLSVVQQIIRQIEASGVSALICTRSQGSLWQYTRKISQEKLTRNYCKLKHSHKRSTSRQHDILVDKSSLTTHVAETK